jgi:hypothetical protein
MKKLSQGEYVFSGIYRGHFACKSKKSNNFPSVRNRRKADLCQVRVKESIGDVTFSQARPQPAEIVFPPFSGIRKVLITSKRYKIEGICQQNTTIKNEV